jgi:hypothetical protein
MSRKVMAKAWLKKAQAMFFGIKPLLLNELIPLSVKVNVTYSKFVATMLYSVEIWETCQQVQMPLQTLLVDVVRVAAGVVKAATASEELLVELRLKSLWCESSVHHESVARQWQEANAD